MSPDFLKDSRCPIFFLDLVDFTTLRVRVRNRAPKVYSPLQGPKIEKKHIRKCEETLGGKIDQVRFLIETLLCFHLEGQEVHYTQIDLLL